MYQKPLIGRYWYSGSFAAERATMGSHISVMMNLASLLNIF